MISIDKLPPTTKKTLSFLGWSYIIVSIVLGVVLTLLHPVLGALYAAFVSVGFLTGLPGGWHYQADVDNFLSQHTDVNRSDLPWPENYDELSRWLTWRYLMRGLPESITNGILLPVTLILGSFVELGYLKEEVLDRLYRK